MGRKQVKRLPTAFCLLRLWNNPYCKATWMGEGMTATAAGVLHDQSFTQWKSGHSWGTCHFFSKSWPYQPSLLQKQLREAGQAFSYYCRFLENLNLCLHVLPHFIFQVVFQNCWLLSFWTVWTIRWQGKKRKKKLKVQILDRNTLLKLVVHKTSLVEPSCFFIPDQLVHL